MKRFHVNWRRFAASALVVAIFGCVTITLWPLAFAQDPEPDPQPITVQFQNANYTLTEGESVTITVTLSQASNNTVTVDYTATANESGSQYQWSDTITFDPGETSKSSTFTVQDDTCCQGTGTVDVVLSNPTGGASLGNPSSMTVTVLDDDVCP